MIGRSGDLLPTAKELQRQVMVKNPERAAEQSGHMAAIGAKQRSVDDALGRPSSLSEDEKIKLASTVIQHAAHNGLTECQIYRFPNSLCTDQGRAVTEGQAGWENTLTGIAREIYQLWVDYLEPRGYRIRFQVIYVPGAVPGEISIILDWNV